MKQFYSLAIFVVITNLLISNATLGQTVGDYRSAGNGNWNSLTTWQRLNALPATWATPSAAQGYPGQNAIPAAVTIQNNNAVTLNVSSISVGSLAISGGGNAASLTVSGSNSLIVTNGVTIGAGTGNGDNIILAIGSGSLSCASISVAAAGNTNRTSGVTVSTGTVTVSGSITFGDTNDDFTFSGAGELSVGGNMSGGSFTASASTVTYNGGTAQIAGAYTYYNLIISGSNTKTLSGSATANDLVINSGATLAVPGGNTLTASNGTGVDITVDGILQNSGTVTLNAGATMAVNSGATYQHSQLGGTVPTATWNANSTCAIVLTNPASGTGSWPAGTGQSFGHFSLTATGTGTNGYQIGGSISCAGNFSVSNGSSRPVILANSGTNRTITVGGNFSLTTGTMDLSSSTGIGTIQVAGNFSHTGGTITESGTGSGAIVFNGSGVQTYTSGGTITNTVNTTVNSGSTLQMAAANTVVSGGGTFTLSSGAKLGITSTAGITGSGASGNIQVSGARSFNTGAGYIYNGSAAQVTGNGLPATINNLTINNGAGVTLSQSVAVAGVSTFTNGIVSLSSNSFTINNGGTVSGASDASFVDGPVKKIGIVGSTVFNFPVGKSGLGYMPIGIANISGATTEFTAQYYRASAKTTFGTTGLVALGLQGVSNCEYWTLDRTVTTSNADITLYWNAHSPCNGATYVANPPLGLRVVHFNTSTNQWDAHGGGSISGTSTAGSVTWTGVSNFSPFALGALVGSQSALPVMYANVKAYAKNSGVQIEWSNLTERDLTGYDIQRSADGITFISFSHQQPKNNLNDKADYTDFDATPLVGTNYYRIKATEISGKIVYSKILRVETGSEIRQQFTIYPNPVTGNQVTIGLNNVREGQYSLRIVNTAGQNVLKQTITNRGTSTTETIQLPASVKPGVYTILISGSDFTESKMFIVQ